MTAPSKVVTVLLLTLPALAAAQFRSEASRMDSSPTLQDTMMVQTSIMVQQEKNYWLPAVEVVGLNAAVWGYHKYLTKEGWANISWETVKANFRTGFVWDYDGYLTNQFSHPYHGAAYFSAARSNGLEFWESAPYAFGGSLMWEYFMEDEPPSYNDIVNTPVTGIILGEISFRIANSILDESTGGFERFTRETAAFVVNPVHGFNRLLRGDMWRQGSKHKEGTLLSSLSLGVDNIFLGRTIANTKSYGYLSLDFNYGDLLEVSRHEKPFDYFTVHAELSLRADDNIVGIFASGVLWDDRVSLFDNHNNIAGLYKEVDILINDVYKFSATAATGRMVNNIALSSGVSLQNSASISAILMGATNSKYTIIVGKDYNIGPGAGAKLNATLEITEFGKVYANYRRYWLHTLSGVAGEEFIGLLNVGASISLFSDTSLGLDFVLYERFGDYKDFPDTQTANAALRTYVRFAI